MLVSMLAADNTDECKWERERGKERKRGKEKKRDRELGNNKRERRTLEQQCSL